MNRAKKRILIVDDIPQNITVLSEILKQVYSLSIATNGAKALTIARSEKSPDLILLDVMMPEMDGYKVLRKLKSDWRTRNIPVVFVTARGEIEDKARGYELGVSDYLTKPIDPHFVLDVMRKFLP